MNEYQYLEALDKALMALSQAERQELLDDYRQHFRDGRANGKTDEEIITQLGDAQDVAQQYLADRQAYYQYPYQPAQLPKKFKKKNWIIAGLTCLGLLLIFGMVIAVNSDLPPVAPIAPEAPIPPIAPEAPEKPDRDYYTGLFAGLGSMADSLVDDIVNAAVSGVWTATTDDIQDLDITQFYTGASKISVEGNYGTSCVIIPEDRNDIAVSVTGQIPAAHSFTVSQNSNSLKIKYNKNGVNVDADTETPALVAIYVPFGWDGRLQVATVRGNIMIEDGAAVTRLEAASASGSIGVWQTDWMERIEAVTTSGDIVLDVNAERIEAINTSGDIWADLMVGRLEAATVSGTVEVALNTIEDRAEVAAVSGDVLIYMPGGYGFKASTISGRITNADGIGHGSAVEVSTVSGSITVFELAGAA